MPPIESAIFHVASLQRKNSVPTEPGSGRKLLTTPTCQVCGNSKEATDHILLHCNFARAFWNAVGLPVADDASIQNMENLPRILAVQRLLRPLLLPTVEASQCIHLQKRELRQVLQACIALMLRRGDPESQGNSDMFTDAWC